MAIHKVTYNPDYRRGNVHNHGCGFKCTWCSYRLKEREMPCRFLHDDEVKTALSNLDVDRVHFIGGEPTTYPGLAELASFAHDEMGVVTKLGHSNGARVPPEGIDEANISIKTLKENIHVDHCGVPSSMVQSNFRTAYENGVKLDASSVLIPGLIDVEEILRIAEFVSSIDDTIPYHIIGYIPVPDAPWRRPSFEEVQRAEAGAKQWLKTVTLSCWSEKEWSMDPAERDQRYRKIRVA
ncbi:MAG: radical SAM protein [Methanomassiliicoccales archaeon]|nr:radical SAM protein [Methanomassiliicoccales archaeon]NYT15876.1 radical SAM protein [Methanomassiliicoccales archaeon]